MIAPIVFLSILSALIDRSSQQGYTCGVSQRTISELIVGGRNAQAQDWPWHAIVFHPNSKRSSEYACGGTLISDTFVLTARHCTMLNGKRLMGSTIMVQFGVQQLYDWNPDSYQQHAVLRVHHVPRHEQWRNLRNDVVLLELKTVVVFTDYVLPACLPDRELVEGELGTVVGFGLLEGGDVVSQTLREAQMAVVNAASCIHGSHLIDEGMICAGNVHGASVSSEDNGGGLVFKRGDSWQLGGIVSYAEQYENLTLIGFGQFVNVFRYLPWIVEVSGLEGDKRASIDDIPLIMSTNSTLETRDCKWLKWDPEKGEPPAGVITGEDNEGNLVFVGRSETHGDLIPGYFFPSSGKMFVHWNSRRWRSVEFEVLTGSGFSWVEDHDGHVPQNAVAGGRTERGDILYVGLLVLDDVWIAGPVFTFRESMVVMDDGAEHIVTEYEVLVHDDPQCQKW